MVKRIGSLVTLLVLVLTECFTPMCCVLAKNNAEPDFEVEEIIGETTDSEDAEEVEEITEEPTEIEETKEIIEETINTEEIEEIEEITEETTGIEESVEETIDTEKIEATEDIELNDIETDKELNKTENESADETTSENEIIEDENKEEDIQNLDDESFKTDSMQNDDEESNNDTPADFQSTGQTSSQVDTTLDAPQNDANKEKENIEEPEGTTDTITEEIKEIISKIRFFFKIDGDSQYIKYGRDTNNIGTITLKDPKSGASITIMDKNLGADNVGDNGYYFQWGNNHGVKAVNSNNKTVEKAVYNDSYYNYGYDGNGMFIVGNSDYWENGEHYNNLWGNENKESSRYGACPAGYHIPTIKEWNQLLSIWGKIHTQDTSTGDIALRYSENYSTKNIHTFKGAATQCTQGESECIDEDRISIIIEVLSSELKLPLAGSYDENGNFHDDLGIYWTSISKNGNSAGVFDVDAYIGDKTDERSLYKAQGHTIRCFQNIEPYVAPVISEPQNDESFGTETNDSEESSLSTGDNQGEINSNTAPQNDEENTQDSYPENNIPSDIESDSIIQDTTGNLSNEEINTKEYTITWKNEDGSIRDTTIVAYGQMPTHENPIQPADAHYSYEFAGWEPELKTVEGDAEYKAKYIYIPVEYTITWKNEDGTIIDTSKVAYGQIPTHKDPIQPADEKYSYKFTGWEPKLSEVKGNTEYRAKYEYIVNKFTITWKNEDGTIIDTTEVAYGQMPTHENPIQPADTHYSYEFSDWEPEISEAIGNTEYRAKYKYTVNKYTVTWKNEDETVLGTGEVEYGTTPIYSGATPTKESTEEFEYTFAGWEPKIEEIKGDVVYTAKYIETSITENEGPKDGNETQTDSLEQNTQDNKQNIQDFVSESQNNENSLSGTQGDEDESSYEGDDNTYEDSSTNISECENTIQEGENSEKNQGFFGGIWETLKSFFLDDEDGYLRGSEIIDNILVSVEAEEGTFPVGTEVIIKGVPQNRLKSIQTSLIEDESNNVTENAQIVAFDISFVYSGKEIQPVKEVSVKFNYKENSDFQGSSMSELSVYHIDDDTDEGEEVEVVNKQGDEIEILATSFSTYALVLTINPSIILHLDAVGGDLSNNTGVTITDTPNVGDGEITADQNGYVTLPTNVTKTGYTFAGWYEDAQYTSPVLLDGSGKYQVDGNTPTLYAKRINGGGAYGVTYVFADDVTFDGTNYINTDLKLFSSSFGKKDFDINFNVDSITAFNPGQNQGRNNIMHIINEKGNPYQGFDLRLENDANSYKGQIRAVSQKDNFTLGNSTSTSSSFRFWTENNVLHYYDNGNDITSQDFSSTVSFDYPLMFGAALNSSMAGRRYMKGTLSDITVYVAYDNGSSITLPEPTRTNKFFNGWYENAQCTIPVQLNENGKYAVGMNKALYADWADYKVTIESNESSYGGVDISEVKVKSGAIVVDNGDNTLTIINTSGKTTTITAIPTPSQYDLFSFVEWNISGCTNTITNNCTIVANFTGDKHFVTFDSNRGTFDIFENMTKSSNPQLIDDGGIVEQPADSELPGYEFLGWFNGNEEWDFDNDTVSENITLTAKRSYLLEYGELDVYTISSSGTKKAFALMDRNVGATGLYNKNFDSPNFESFGYAYQWGNNYGFNKVEGNGNSYNQEYISGNAVAHDVWSSHLASQFANKTWITVNPWNDGATKNDYLWGRVTDPYEAMQGPCPDGYHVPTQNEFSNELYNNWSDVYGNGTRFKSAEQQYFTKDLLFPMAGSRSNGSIVDDRQGICAEYWEAGPSNVVERATDLWFCKDNEVQNYKGTFSRDSASYRYNGLSVRCFKNDTNNATVDFSMNGGTKALVSVQKINGVNTIISTKDPVKDGMEFGGRYSSSNFEGNTRKTEGSIISGGNVTLYAKWNCPTGQALNGQGQCVSGVTVTFHDEDGALLESVSVLSGNSATYPNVDPIKDGGYEFDGWVLSDRETFADLTNVIEDMDVYAHFHGGCPEDYEWDGSGCVLKSYTITFVDWDGSIITSETYHSGDNINVPANPTKEADEIYTYNFSGWDPTVAIVTGDMTYTATYTSQINKYTVTIGVLPVDYGTVSSESVTADYGIPITTSDNTLTIGSTTIIATPATSGAQYTYTFSGWSFNNCGSGGEEEIRSNCEITANFDRTVNEYTVTWKNWDNSVIKIDTGVAYGTTPEYSGPIPEKPSDLIHAYVFSGWTPAITEVYGDQEYTAVYSHTTRKYDVTWRNIDGTVLEKDTNVGSGSWPQYSGSIPTNGASNQYVTSAFAGWNPALSPVVKDVEYMARYTYTVTSGYVLDTTKNSVHLILNGNGGEFSNNSGYDVVDYDYYNRAEIEYSHGSNYSDDGIRNTSATNADDGQYLTTITGAEYLYLNLTYDLHEILLGLANSNKDKLYIHAGTSLDDEIIAQFSGNTNDGIQGNENFIISGDSVLLDFYLVPRSLTDVESNGFYAVIVGVIPVGYITDDEAQTPTKEGYTFDGWYTQAEGGDEIIVDNISMTGNLEVFAHWIPNTGIDYKVYHYVKIAGQSGYALSKTDYLTGTTDEILILSSLAKESEFICAHYSSGSLTGTENGPGEIITQTNLKGDGTTKIYLYYIRNSYTVTLSRDEHIQMLKINGNETNQATLECGSEVPVEAVPKPGYHFVRWDKEEKEENENENEGPP